MKKALLEEEEQKQEELLTHLRQRGKEEKKKKQEKKSKKQKYQEDEEEQFIDDEDRDPDFDPDKEEDVADDDTIEDENEEDTFQVEKHSHALNFSEAGEFVVWVRGKLEELERAVRQGREMDIHYKTFVSILKDAIIKMGTYAPIEGADIDAVIQIGGGRQLHRLEESNERSQDG